MMQKILMLVVSLALVLSAACNAGPQALPGQVTPPAAPESDKATVTGRVLGRTSGQPLASEIIRLAEVFREGEKGAYVLDMAFSPGTRADDDGYFIFENIPAGEYVLVVGDYYAAYDIIEEETSAVARVWNAQAGKVLDMGVIRAQPQVPGTE